jgi:hypothetical protein
MSEIYNVRISDATVNERVNEWHAEAAAMLDAAKHTMAQALELASGQQDEEMGAILNVLWANLKGLGKEFDELERIFTAGLPAH